MNGFYVYLYDGPRVQEFDRPGVANVDKIKNKVSVFLGIPYAQAPIGEARLMVRINLATVSPSLGLDMIGYRIGEIILKFPSFSQFNEEHQEWENSK